MAEETENKQEAAAAEAPKEAPTDTAVKEAPEAASEAAAPKAASADTPAKETPKAAAADTDSGAQEEAPVARKRVRGGRAVPVGVAHIKASFNNTQVAITDPKGGVISWSSAGRAGFKGSRKSTAFAATMVAQEAARTAAAKGMHEIVVRLQGAGAGRESAVRGLQSAGLSVSMIQDVTPVAHNGCRARKRRRV